MIGSKHVRRERLCGFLIYERPLNEEEHEHLDRCPECVQMMVESALEELKKDYGHPGQAVAV